MPRRYADYLPEDGFTILNQISTFGAFFLALSTLPFLWNVYKTAKSAPKVTVDDPWGYANSLEWATSCPPPRHNFVSIPRIRSERPAFDLHYPEAAAVDDQRRCSRQVGELGDTDEDRIKDLLCPRSVLPARGHRVRLPHPLPGARGVPRHPALGGVRVDDRVLLQDAGAGATESVRRTAPRAVDLRAVRAIRDFTRRGRGGRSCLPSAALLPLWRWP